MDLKPGMTFEGAVSRYWPCVQFGLGQSEPDLIKAYKDATCQWASTIGSYRIIIKAVTPAYVDYDSYFVQEKTGTLFQISKNKRSVTFHESIVFEINAGVMRPINADSCPTCNGAGNISKDQMLEIAGSEFQAKCEVAVKKGESVVQYWFPSIMVTAPNGVAYFNCPTCSKKLETVAHLGTRVLDL